MKCISLNPNRISRFAALPMDLNSFSFGLVSRLQSCMYIVYSATGPQFSKVGSFSQCEENVLL